MASAVAVYDQYRARQTVLEPYAAMRQAAQYVELGQLDTAAQSFTNVASTSDINRAERAGSYERAIGLYRQLGQDAEALRLYGELLAFAEVPVYRARILSEAATLAEAVGDTTQALAWRREIIDLAPRLPFTQEWEGVLVSETVRQLLAADPTFPTAAAGRVLFDTGYVTEALPLLETAISQLPAESEETLDLRRRRALIFRTQDDFATAQGELEAISAAAPDSDVGRQALLDLIQTIGQSGDIEQAIARYQDYANTYSDDPRAPAALDRAAQLRDRLGDTEGAAQVRVALGLRHPDSSIAAPVLNQAGWYYYAAATSRRRSRRGKHSPIHRRAMRAHAAHSGPDAWQRNRATRSRHRHSLSGPMRLRPIATMGIVLPKN
ncbi:MAG: hypothetical protein HC914_03405 [Chloroflexaceae bacterium]|nr:hypothetical protein [Chloroflexaceae bacterium]